MFKENSIIATYHALREIVDFRKKLRDRSESDSYSFDWEIVLSSLKPNEFKEWLHVLSSYNQGRYIFDQTFPRIDNPEDFHSTEAEIDLSDHPVQAIGYEEVEMLKKQAQLEGLNKDWVDIGFVWRAQERGIDLEWHFRATVPQRDEGKLSI